MVRLENKTPREHAACAGLDDRGARALQLGHEVERDGIGERRGGGRLRSRFSRHRLAQNTLGEGLTWRGGSWGVGGRSRGWASTDSDLVGDGVICSSNFRSHCGQIAQGSVRDKSR